jgi:predicted RNA binding protein YcfA (HicA-like mRNA interferase family)
VCDSRGTYNGRVAKVREIIKLVQADGWCPVVTRGSHRQFKHPTKPGRVTIAGHPSDTLCPDTLGSILRQAGIDREGRQR